MSVQDIGPALPPHMRKNHGSTEELGNCSEKKNRDLESEKRRKYGDKSSEQEEQRNRDRGRSRRDGYQDGDRSSRYYGEKDRDKQREKREEVRDLKTKELLLKDTKKFPNSCKRSKRSKTDRTYNTDTEESSDDGGYNTQKWDRVNHSDSSDSEERGETPSRKGSLMSASDIGPALPPHLKLKLQHKQEDSAGLAEPLHNTDNGGGQGMVVAEVENIGPALPPHLVKSQVETVRKEDKTNTIGPALPPHLMEERSTSTSNNSCDKSVRIGPALPPGSGSGSFAGTPLPEPEENDGSSDDEVVGPLLPEEMMRSEKNYVIQAQLERNAAALRRKQEDKDSVGAGVQVREEWMLQLPPEGTVDLGLGPRTFRARGAPEKGTDRSSWTDTPADKVRKEEEAKRRFELGVSSTDEVKKAGLSRELSSRDKSMEVVVKKHKRSKESLLDSHQKKLKKEKKKKEDSGVKQARRPFDRDADLKTNVFDDAQKKAIYKKAQLLDSRFSGGESKFL